MQKYKKIVMFIFCIGIGVYYLYNTNFTHFNNQLELSNSLQEKINHKFPLKIKENIYLIKLKSQDSFELHELIDKNRLYLKKTLPWLNYSNTVQDSKNFISQSNNDFLKKSLILGIKSRKLIGIISFNTIDWIKKEAEVGYWLDAEMQGKGIVTTSCKHLNDLGLEKIVISCSTTNIKSQSIAKRLGFQEECLVPNKEFLYDHYVDHILFSKTRKEYLKEQNQ